MKIFKRIIAVALIIILTLAVGYLFFTGSRLADTQQEMSKQSDGDIAVLFCDGDDKAINF